MQDNITNWIDSQKNSSEDIEISIIIPAYNEKWRLPTTLIEIIDFLESSKIPSEIKNKFEVIVVDDGSNDETSEVVKKFQKVKSQIKLITLPTNQGKGFAVKMGMLNALGKKLLFTDADGSSPIEEFLRLNKEIENGCDVVIGSRAIKSSETEIKTVWYRKFIGRTFNFLVNTLLVPNIEDTQCGFKLFTAKAASKIFRLQRSKGFSFDVEILFLARKLGFTIKEVPINWHNVPGSKVNLVVDSLKMFLDIFRFRVIHRRSRRRK